MLGYVLEEGNTLWKGWLQCRSRIRVYGEQGSLEQLPVEGSENLASQANLPILSTTKKKVWDLPFVLAISNTQYNKWWYDNITAMQIKESEQEKPKDQRFHHLGNALGRKVWAQLQRKQSISQRLHW